MPFVGSAAEPGPAGAASGTVAAPEATDAGPGEEAYSRQDGAVRQGRLSQEADSIQHAHTLGMD